MCGISFCLYGVKVQNNCFFFNPYSNYINNPYFWDKKEELQNKHFGSGFDYIKYIVSKQLLISDFGCKHIRESICNRGPDGFRLLMITEDSASNHAKKYTFRIINDEQELSSVFSSPDQKLRIVMANSLLHLRGDQKCPNYQPVFSDSCAFIYNGEIFKKQQHKNQQIKKTCNISLSTNATDLSKQEQMDEEVKFSTQFSVDPQQQQQQSENVQNQDFDFDVYENDTVQLFNIIQSFCRKFSEQIHNCKEVKEKYQFGISSIIQQFVGDFSFVFFDGYNHKLIVSKDIFGKRSLLLGFNENGFALSSVAVNVNEKQLILNQQGSGEEGEEVDIEDSYINQKKKQDNGQEDSKEDHDSKQKRLQFLETKYLQDYLVAREREWIELPNNNLIFIDIVSEEQLQMGFSGTQLNWSALEINQAFYTTQLPLILEPSQPISNIPQEVIQVVIKELKSSVKRLNGTTQLQSIEQLSDNLHKQHLESPVLTSAKISVLFSGGLDSTLLTRLIDELLPDNEEIDLINVSFSKDSHDRKTAISAYQELQGINNKRKYNLILIDKTLQDVEVIEKKILKLIYPKITHMDFNIAAVLHFATQGCGLVKQEQQSDQQLMKSGAKVVISGLGADEIFGGYSRYRVAFLRNGFKELLQEQKFDLNRLWIRNLGRDDRAISENGVEARFPFLDEHLITQVNQIDYRYFTNFNLPRGTGDKVLLRAAAASLGLKIASSYKKRAIQFGTGIAKQSNIKNFGSNRKAKGTYIYQLKNKN